MLPGFGKSTWGAALAIVRFVAALCALRTSKRKKVAS